MSEGKPAEVKVAALSGFCNPSWSLDTPHGRASHNRCRKDDCPCDCGLGIHPPKPKPQRVWVTVNGVRRLVTVLNGRIVR